MHLEEGVLTSQRHHLLLAQHCTIRALLRVQAVAVGRKKHEKRQRTTNRIYGGEGGSNGWWERASTYAMAPTRWSASNSQIKIETVAKIIIIV